MPLHSRAFSAIEQAELDSGAVGDPAHHPIHRVDLTHQVALAKPTNRRIAGHHANCVAPESDKGGPDPDARGSGSSLAPCVAAPDHDDIALFHVKHSTLLADAEPRKNLIQQGFDIDFADQRFHGTGSTAKIVRNQLCRFASPL